MAITAKISNYQLAILLFLSRLFSECINYPFEYSNYEMQRLTVVIIANILVFLAYLPLIIFSAKNPGESFFTAIAGKSKPLGWLIFVLMSFQILSEAILSMVKLEFFTTNTLMPSAPTWLIILLMSAVAIYGTVKGIQAVARISIAVLVLFLCVLVLGTISVADDMNFLYLYPALVDSPSTFRNDILEEFCKNNELFIFAVLCQYVSKKPERTIYIYMPALLTCTLYIFLLHMVTLGPYIEIISFPFYSLSAYFDIIIFDRMDGMDVIIWTVTAVMKIILFFLCIKAMLASLVKEEAAKRTTVVIIAASCALGLFFASNYSAVNYLFHDWEFIASVILLLVIMPIIALFIKRSKNNGQSNKNQNPPQNETGNLPDKVVFDELD